MEPEPRAESAQRSPNRNNIRAAFRFQRDRALGFQERALVAEQGLRRTTALTNLLLQQLNDRKYNQAESTAHMTLFGLTQ